MLVSCALTEKKQVVAKAKEKQKARKGRRNKDLILEMKIFNP